MLSPAATAAVAKFHRGTMTNRKLLPFFQSAPDSHFELDRGFVARFGEPDWGPLGKVTFERTYAREKLDGSKERFVDTLERVVNGVYQIQQQHAHNLGVPFDLDKAQRSAQKMFKLMHEFKFLPPGRGLWAMGADVVRTVGGACLANCGFISTNEIDSDFTRPFTFVMDFSMLGVGCGFDTEGAGKRKIVKPTRSGKPFVIPDDREGWVEALRRVLAAYAGDGFLPNFDYSAIRPYGAPIRGFGGQASGPEPLQTLLETDVPTILNKCVGRAIDSTAIVDLMCVIGKCVVAGNVRRTALIAFGDPSDVAYRQLKDPNLFSAELKSHRWASNNSVFADGVTDYTPFAQQLATNGEPGFVWLDNAHSWGRYGDGRTDDYRVKGTNPCLAGETLIQTTTGPRRIDSIDGSFWAVVDGKAYRASASWQSGVKDIFRLRTAEGYEVNLTDNHQVLRADGSWIEAGQLKPGDQIRIHNQRNIPNWAGAGTFEEGYLLGIMVGDGGFEGDTPVAKVWDADVGAEGIAASASTAADLMPKRSDWGGWRDHGRGYRAMTLSRDLCASFDIAREKILGEKIETASSNFQRGFLRGMFDTDGHVETNSAKGSSVRLSQSDYARLTVIQRMLLRLGVKSRIYDSRPEGTRELPDGRGGTKEYHTKASYRLVLSADDIPVFATAVGFAHLEKSRKLKELTSNQRFYAKPFVATVESFEYVRTDKVYDLTVDKVHAMDANGLYVHNCAEQVLESNELCNLVETFPSRHDSPEEFHETLKFAYLYAKTVTLIPLHDSRSNAIQLRNRRIGTSMTGIVAAMKKFGRQKFLDEFCAKGYDEVRAYDRQYSEWMCVPQSIRVTTVKPSGTVSLLPGVPPGIHYPIAEYYIRRIRVASNSPLVDIYRNAGYKVEPDVYSKTSVVIEFPVREANFDRSEDMVSMWEQLENTADMQKYWSDNAVSVTIKFRPDEAKDIARAVAIFAPRLKTVSFLPYSGHGYEQAPYEPISKEQYETMCANIVSVMDVAPHEADDKYCDGDKCTIPMKG